MKIFHQNIQKIFVQVLEYEGRQLDVSVLTY